MRDQLEGTTWLLTDPAPPDGIEVVASFADGNVTGTSGCNRFRGTYTVEAEQLVLGPLMTTQMAAEPHVMAFEREVLDRLAKVTAFTVAGPDLRMNEFDSDGSPAAMVLTDDHSILLVFHEQADDGHIGDWTVTGIHYPDRQAIISVDESNGALTVTFEGDRVHGQSGCNSFAGHLTFDQGSVNIGPLMGTRKFCAGGDNPTIMEQEAALLRAIEHTVALRLEGDRLTMARADGGISVSLSRSPARTHR
jgi:heat shock protein HslJ